VDVARFTVHRNAVSPSHLFALLSQQRRERPTHLVREGEFARGVALDQLAMQNSRIRSGGSLPPNWNQPGVPKVLC
jgi:hypothetical protein